MSLQMFRSNTSLSILEEEIEQNLKNYKTAGFDEFLLSQKLVTIAVDCDVDRLSELDGSGGATGDLKNSLLVWDTLKISPRIAKEARLWALLTHSVGLDYVRKRWPLSEKGAEDAIKHIKKHYLVQNDKRGIERDNALSRLWTSAYVASRVETMELEEALGILLFQTDVRAQIVERPSIMMSPRLLTCVLETARRILLVEQDEGFFARKAGNGQYRKWFQELNLEAGVRLFDTLSKAKLGKIVDSLAEKHRV